MGLIGGVGGEHGSDFHHVTSCIHDHSHYRKEGGAAANAGSQMSQLQMQKQQQDAQLSLSDWFRRVVAGGRRLLKGIWGTNETNSTGAAGDKAGRGHLMAQVGDSTAADGRAGGNDHVAAAHNAAAQGNPYFFTVQERNAAAHMTPFQRARAKVVAAAEKLAGKLPGKSFRFQAKNSFQTKPENHPRENLKKRSKYRKDELEIDCILTDESYLMDSYDRNGEYRQLTTKK